MINSESEAIDIIKCLAWHTRPDEEDIEQAIKALEQQPCEDCISRQAVIRLVEQYPNIIGNRCSGLIADIKHLPSVTPKQRVGKWIVTGYDYKCTNCEAEISGEINYMSESEIKYCPYCGIKMEVEENG